VRVVGGRPLVLRVGELAADLDPAERAFLVARALERARSGSFAVDDLAPAAIDEIMRAARRVLAAEPEREGGSALANEVSRWLRGSEAPAAEARGRLLADIDAALARPADEESFRRGCALSADRVGVLAAGDPHAALRALAGAQR